MSRATSTVQVDDARVRVTQWDFAPGTDTGFHTHEMDYVVVPMTSGILTLTDAQGCETTSALTVGQAYSRAAGVAHNVMNRTDERIVFIEVEHKT
jgi:quercetin dioxygenase-like cupin family protein